MQRCFEIGWNDTRGSKIFITLALRQNFIQKYINVFDSMKIFSNDTNQWSRNLQLGGHRQVVVMWPGHNLLPLVETGLTDLPKPRWTIAHSVHSSPTWGHIFNQLLSIEAERLLISKYEFSLSMYSPLCIASFDKLRWSDDRDPQIQERLV